MYLLRVLSLIQELRFNVSVSVSMSGSGAVGLGVGVGSYQPGVYVPLKALFLVLEYTCSICLSLHMVGPSMNTKNHYTPGIDADGYIVFAFPFIRWYIRSLVCS